MKYADPREIARRTIAAGVSAQTVVRGHPIVPARAPRSRVKPTGRGANVSTKMWNALRSMTPEFMPPLKTSVPA